MLSGCCINHRPLCRGVSKLRMSLAGDHLILASLCKQSVSANVCLCCGHKWELSVPPVYIQYSGLRCEHSQELPVTTFLGHDWGWVYIYTRSKWFSWCLLPEMVLSLHIKILCYYSAKNIQHDQLRLIPWLNDSWTACPVKSDYQANYSYEPVFYMS